MLNDENGKYVLRISVLYIGGSRIPAGRSHKSSKRGVQQPNFTNPIQKIEKYLVPYGRRPPSPPHTHRFANDFHQNVKEIMKRSYLFTEQISAVDIRIFAPKFCQHYCPLFHLKTSNIDKKFISRYLRIFFIKGSLAMED